MAPADRHLLEMGDTLAAAARKGHTVVAKVLLQAGADPNHLTADRGVSPLHAAAAAEQIPLLEVGLRTDTRKSREIFRDVKNSAMAKFSAV